MIGSESGTVVFPSTEAPIADVQIQPAGFVLELSPDWLIIRASENTHKFLGEYHVRLIGEPLTQFTMAQPLHDLRNLLSRQSGNSGPSRAYRVRLIDGQRYFDIAFQQTGGRILLEGVPSQEEGFGAALGSVSRLLDGLAGNSRQALLEGGARRMRALTGYDRVTVSIDTGAGEETAESSRGNFAPRAKPPHVGDLPMLVADTKVAPIGLFPRNPDDRVPQGAVLRSPDAQQLTKLQEQGIRSTLDVPILIDGEVVGLFECEDRSPHPPDFELHAAAELFAQLFAYRLEIERLRTR